MANDHNFRPTQSSSAELDLNEIDVEGLPNADLQETLVTLGRALRDQKNAVKRLQAVMQYDFCNDRRIDRATHRVEETNSCIRALGGVKIVCQTIKRINAELRRRG